MKKIFLFFGSAAIFALAFIFAGGNSVQAADFTAAAASTSAPSLADTQIFTLATSTAGLSSNIASLNGATSTERGFVWATTTNPTVSDNLGRIYESGYFDIGSFSNTATGLVAGRYYYIRAYAVNSAGTGYASSTSLYITPPVTVYIPTLSGTTILSASTTVANLSSSIVSSVGAGATERGFVWSTVSGPTIASNLGRVYQSGTFDSGSFSNLATGLVVGRTNYIRSYAVNSAGIGYGSSTSYYIAPLVTTTAPVLSTTAVGTPAIATTTFSSSITSTGNASSTERGFVWATTTAPTVSSNLGRYYRQGTFGRGSFSGYANNLTAGRTYYVRAYAVNSAGTGYGAAASFYINRPATSTPTSTVVSVPTLYATAVSVLTSATSSFSSSITSTGNASSTERGFVWATTTNPTVSSNLGRYYRQGTFGRGSFSGYAGNLKAGKTYYVRAYAVNSAGTGYGAAASFRINVSATSTPITSTPTTTAPTATTTVKSLASVPATVMEQVSQSESNQIVAKTVYVALDSGAKTAYDKIMAGIQTSAASSELRKVIANFIQSGTETTKVLGAGERAGVVSSFRSVFGRLPQNSADWKDVVKIANGRWPSQTSAVSETAAKTNWFKKIYLRDPNMSNANDNAAVTVIAYGLRPAARNLSSEATAIKTFKYVFKRNPSAAADWDAVRAIAYSGAKR